MAAKSFNTNEFMSNKTQIGYLALCVIVPFYLFLYFVPNAKTLIKKLSESSQLQAKIVQTESDWANVDTFKNSLAQVYEKIGGYEKELPGEKEIPQVLEYLSTAAKRMDVRLTEIKPIEHNDAAEEIYYSLPILLKAECGYHQLGRFLSELERADRFMKISDIKILANPQKSSNVHYAQIIVVTYVMRK